MDSELTTIYKFRMKLEIPSFEILKLKTPRIDLEPVTIDHARELFDLFADDRLHTFVPFEPPTLQRQQERCAHWANRISPDETEVWLNWAARCTSSGQVIGHFQSGYKKDGIASIGYVVAMDFQGKGLALEALQEIFSLLRKQLTICEVRAWSDTRNVASHRLAEKLGMKQIEVIKDADFFKGSTSDEYVFSIKF